jgi:hypothetical protein
MVAKDEVLARTPQRRLGITRGLRSCECIGRFAAQLVDRDHRHDDGDETECGDVDESARETLQRHARERERRAQSTCGGLRHRQMQDARPPHPHEAAGTRPRPARRDRLPSRPRRAPTRCILMLRPADALRRGSTAKSSERLTAGAKRDDPLSDREGVYRHVGGAAGLLAVLLTQGRDGLDLDQLISVSEHADSEQGARSVVTLKWRRTTSHAVSRSSCS